MFTSKSFIIIIKHCSISLKELSWHKNCQFFNDFFNFHSDLNVKVFNDIVLVLDFWSCLGNLWQKSHSHLITAFAVIIQFFNAAYIFFFLHLTTSLKSRFLTHLEKRDEHWSTFTFNLHRTASYMVERGGPELAYFTHCLKTNLCVDFRFWIFVCV